MANYLIAWPNYTHTHTFNLGASNAHIQMVDPQSVHKSLRNHTVAIITGERLQRLLGAGTTHSVVITHLCCGATVRVYAPDHQVRARRLHGQLNNVHFSAVHSQSAHDIKILVRARCAMVLRFVCGVFFVGPTVDRAH